jgi:hypothetical protein
VRGGPKTLLVALAVLLIAVGLAACGSSDSSSSTTTGADKGQAESKSSQEAPKQSGVKSEEGKPGSGSEGQSGSSGPSASDFTPKHHTDSGGGSEQFRVKGGDNSVQEFGGEADTSERDAAAVALHNFLDARAEGNWAAACQYMSKSTVESFEKLAAQAKQVGDTSCAGILEKLTNPAAKGAMKAEAEKANVGSLRIEGEQAFVIYTGIDGTVLVMPMANEGGDWKVASLAGTPLS